MPVTRMETANSGRTPAGDVKREGRTSISIVSIKDGRRDCLDVPSDLKISRKTATCYGNVDIISLMTRIDGRIESVGDQFYITKERISAMSRRTRKMRTIRAHRTCSTKNTWPTHAMKSPPSVTRVEEDVETESGVGQRQFVCTILAKARGTATKYGS